MATYLITQATGQQSQSAILHLLESGAKIHGLVRDLEKVPSSFRNPNITLFQGESKNFEDVFRAAQGCSGVFLNTVPYPGLEVLQAKTIVEACQDAGVGTIVTSTTHNTAMKDMWDDDATKKIGLHEYFTSKAAVESIVRTGQFRSYTILRPAVLHQDLHLPGSLGMFPRLSTHGVLDHLLEDGVKLPYTDTNDVGKYIAAALQEQEKFGGEEIDLGSEMLTIEETRDILKHISGREVMVAKRTLKEMEDMGISVFGQRFCLFANTKTLSWTCNNAKDVQQKYGIPFTSVSEALRRDKAKVLECLPGEPMA